MLDPLILFSSFNHQRRTFKKCNKFKKHNLGLNNMIDFQKDTPQGGYLESTYS